MFTPPVFREDDTGRLIDFARAHAFALMVTSGPSGLGLTHLPFLIDRDADDRVTLLGHLARANPHWRELETATETRVIFTGPHCYISPRWYAHRRNVPTWNYTAVHMTGRASIFEDPDRLHRAVDRLAAEYEASAADPWRPEDMPEPAFRGMLGGIVGVTVAVESMNGKFKLNQNKTAEDRDLVIEHLSRGSADERAVAGMMIERGGA